ncbi:protein ENL isoform X5 [Pangasianodon hypophthalmus]|uniref:protein ENL isoform X5 n=1 Tax=Pangasianodon hypophthalmus TaxID=310915 RepID=UPI002307EF09|nr:protein ENL isoform X5 [Pangasianodon hypophthalmus]
MEEHKKVCFNCDLFLNQESNPPVSHLRYEKLTFNNKKHKFHHKVVKTGGVMVVPEGTEMMPRAGVDYSMLSTTALSAVSDHKKIKSHQAMKEPNKDRAGGVGKGHKHYKPNREHREHKNSESKTTSREREHVGGKSTLELSSSSSSRKSTENRGKDEGKNMAKVAFKEPKNTTRESKRPSSTTKSSNLSTKKLKSLKGCKEGGSITISSRISSTSAAPPSTYLEKKGTKEKGHWSVQSTSSSSCSTSGSDSEFEPLQMQSQGPLHAMVEHLPSERSDDDRSSEVETGMKATPTVQDSCLFMDSDSDDVEESHPHSQEVLSPIPKLSTKNLKMLEKKNPDSCKREKVLKGDKAYTEELVDLHRRLMALRERNVLQQIVNLIEKTGHFNVTKTTFDFDLFSLDESTVRKLQSYLQAKRT